MKRKLIFSLILSVMMIANLVAFSSAKALAKEQTPVPFFPQDPHRVQKAGTLAAAQCHDQLLMVAVENQKAYLSMYEKDTDGTWKELLITPAYIGRNGIGKTKEGDGKTPTGLYHMPLAFGISPDPGTLMPYIQADSSCYWVDDPASCCYNQFVSTRLVPVDWNSAEHITDIRTEYQYVLALDYNIKQIPGAGSAIFLHCYAKDTTSGCIAVSQDSMQQILRFIRPGAAIIIDRASLLKNY